MDLKTLLGNYTRQWLLKTQKYKIHKDNYVNNRMTNDTITERCVLPKRHTNKNTHTHTLHHNK